MLSVIPFNKPMHYKPSLLCLDDSFICIVARLPPLPQLFSHLSSLNPLMYKCGISLDPLPLPVSFLASFKEPRGSLPNTTIQSLSKQKGERSGPITPTLLFILINLERFKFLSWLVRTSQVRYDVTCQNIPMFCPHALLTELSDPCPSSELKPLMQLKHTLA